MLLNKEKESRVKFNPGLSANRPSNNWVQVSTHFTKTLSDVIILTAVGTCVFLVEWILGQKAINVSSATKTADSIIPGIFATRLPSVG